MKRLASGLCLVLLAAVLLAAMPKTAHAAVSWTLDGGVLTISGSGAMANYAAASDAPWYSRRAEITKIVVQSGVTSIGDNSFTWCENVTSVSLPDGLTSIGKNAFWGCADLKTVALPDSLEYIGTCAFFKSGLTAISIPQKVTELEQGIFGQCESLQSVTLHDGITVIRKDAFSRCYALSRISLPAGLESIGEHAFFACVLLQELEFGEELTQIGSAAFYGCGQLSKLTFKGSAPNLSEDAFLGLTAAVSYPTHDKSWENVAGNSYGGDITWNMGCQHNYTSAFTPPTCEEEGYSTFTCTLCGHSYVGLYVDALGHSFTNYISDGNATVESDGTKTAYCDRGCGATDTIVDEGSRLPATITSDVYKIGEETVSCVPTKTTVKEFKDNIQPESIRILKDGKEVAADALIGTGMVVQLLSGDQVVGGWVIIVTGDVNGDGQVSVTDMIAVKAHVLQKNTLAGVAAQAADTSGDHNISITDFIQIKAHILGKSQITPN